MNEKKKKSDTGGFTLTLVLRFSSVNYIDLVDTFSAGFHALYFFFFFSFFEVLESSSPF